MRADFALDLSHDCVRLLEQTEFGDEVLGEVPLAEAGFGRRLAELRRAAGHDGPLPVDLLIPSALILYRPVDPGRPIPEQLQGATQYEVEGLVWSLSEDGSRVALVARETLEEAAAFATSHDFAPVSFTARPQPGDFPGRPVFDPDARPPEPVQVQTEPFAFRSHRQETDAGPAEPVPVVTASRLTLVAPTAAVGEAAAPSETPQLSGAAPPAPTATDTPAAAPPSGRGAQTPEAAQSGSETPTLFGARQRIRAGSRRRWLAGLAGVAATVATSAALAWFVFTDAPESTVETERASAVTESAPAPTSIAETSVVAQDGTGDVASVSIEAAQSPPNAAETPAATPNDPAPEVGGRDAGPIWVAPEPEPAPEIASGLPDPAPSPDATALAAPSIVHDPAPAPVQLPPPAGRTFDMDPRGLVRASPEGSPTPDGIVVFAGPPPLLPPLRGADGPIPERAVANAEPEEEAPAAIAEAGPAAGPAATGDAPADAAELAPTGATSEEDETSSTEDLAGASLLEPQATADAVPPEPARAIPRPELRPDDAPTLADLAVSVEDGPVRPRPRPSTTDSAVAAALASAEGVPNFDALAAEAREQASRASARLAVPPSAAPESRSSAAPQEERSQEAAPKVPTRASVARNATIEDAVRMNRINLIGVYGPPSNRRALIRLPSGRYVKVKVGDRVDGGQVSAIATDRLDYVKGGRTVSLAMPRT